MDKKESVFNSKIETGFVAQDYKLDYQSFKDVVRNRRSVRVYSDEVVSDEVIDRALDDAMLAPNSSNLQPWHFLWIKSPELKKEVAKICFNQNGARTASHLIVFVAKTNTWQKHCKLMLSELSKSGQPIPKVVNEYYSKLAPMAYGMMGPFGIFSPFKWLFFTFMGIFKNVPRKPMFPWQLREWATKSTALACENFMLSISAQGYDSLPMEGYDECRLKKALKLSRHDHVTMVISVGKRASNGIYGPQFRFNRERFITKL